MMHCEEEEEGIRMGSSGEEADSKLTKIFIPHRLERSAQF
jgi:hypothetical protein